MQAASWLRESSHGFRVVVEPALAICLSEPDRVVLVSALPPYVTWLSPYGHCWLSSTMRLALSCRIHAFAAPKSGLGKSQPPQSVRTFNALWKGDPGTELNVC